MAKPIRKEILDYILINLPIFDEMERISLEQVAKEFGLDNYEAEATQEEIVEHIIENSI